MWQSVIRDVGQMPQVRVDRPLRVPEPERRVAPAQHHVRIVERLDRPDVGPVAPIEIGHDLVLAERVRDQLAAEIDARLRGAACPRARAA